MKRTTLAALLCTLLLAPRARAGAPASPFELEDSSIEDLQRAMTSGKYTARKIAELYLARIEAIDHDGPRLASVVELNPDALTTADALDRERAEKGPRGPLHGIPVLLKDNIDTADRMMTTAGSLALVGPPASADAFIVKRLRAAGAVILGKTNMSEWANARSGKSTSGWSARGGLVRNPYALDRNACGSSSGSGVAVAASLAAGAVGTETDGSIVCPAAANGVVGIKPTLGLLSRAGIVPLAHSQDTPGPMGRTVRDAAILLGAMTGPDPDDPATKPSALKWRRDYTTALDGKALEGARIGVMRGRFWGQSPATDKVMEAALLDLKRAGAVLVDPANILHVGEYDDSELSVLLYEIKADLAAYLAKREGLPVHSLKDVIEWNVSHAEVEMPYFGQDLFERAEKKGPLTEPAYLAAKARARRLARRDGIDATLLVNKLDALVVPTGGPAWTSDLVNGDHYGGGSSTPAAVAGYPSVTVPAGLVHGLPVGLSFVGAAWSEPSLLRFAYAYEQATKHRHPPTFASTAAPAEAPR
jgi:amidase